MNLLLLQDDLESYGIDWDGPTPSHTSSTDVADRVEVPETSIPAGVSLLDLENSVNPLASSDEYGMDLYLKVLDMVAAAANQSQ